MPWSELLPSLSDPAPEVRVRREIGVCIRIWGWDDDQLDAAVHTLQLVRDIVAEGFFYGSEIADIEQDILDHTGQVFIEADLTLGENDEFELIIIPQGLDDDAGC